MSTLDLDAIRAQAGTVYAGMFIGEKMIALCDALDAERAEVEKLRAALTDVYGRLQRTATGARARGYFGAERSALVRRERDALQAERDEWGEQP